MADRKEYGVTVYYPTSRTIIVSAKNRQEAIEKAAKKARDLGIEPTTLRVPFLEGDE